MSLINLVKLYFKPSGMLRLAPWLLIIPIIVFHGCVSTAPLVPNIYVVKLHSNTNVSETPLQVRIGYFGICGIDEEGTRCQAATGRSVETIASNLFPEVLGRNANSSAANGALGDDITDLVTTAVDLQSGTFIAVLTGASVLFVFAIAALVLLKRDVASGANWAHPNRSTIIRRTAYGMLFGSTALVFAAALATSQAAGALEYASAGMSHASVLIEAGTTLQVLQWITLGFQVLFALAVPFLVSYRAPADEGSFKGEA